jgi:integrase
MAEGTFLRLRKTLSWPPTPGGRAPRVHDLRHTFACRRLLLWYAQGVDVDRAVHALSTYLGHAGARDTYWYLTAVPELLERAAARFERAGSPDPGDRP